MNLYGNKLYIKIVDLDEIYNFLVQNYFIQSHLGAQIIVTSFISKIKF